MKPVRKRWGRRNAERLGTTDWYRIAALEVRNGREPVGSTPPLLKWTYENQYIRYGRNN